MKKFYTLEPTWPFLIDRLARARLVLVYKKLFFTFINKVELYVVILHLACNCWMIFFNLVNTYIDELASAIRINRAYLLTATQANNKCFFQKKTIAYRSACAKWSHDYKQHLLRERSLSKITKSNMPKFFSY